MRQPRLVLVLLLAALSPTAGIAQDLELTVQRAFDGSRWIEGPVHVRVRAGAIAEVSAAPAGAESLPGVLTPGLVDLDSDFGLESGRDERTESISTDLRVLDSSLPEDAEIRAWRRSGVTTLWLSAGPTGTVGGRGAVVRLAPDEPMQVMAREWGYSASLAADARLPDRAPTSLPEQLHALEDALRAPGGPPGPTRVRFDDAASLRLAAAAGALVMGVPEAALLPELSELGGARLVVSGMGPWTSEEQVRAAVRSGAVAGFGSGGAGGPASIRPAAARMVQEGWEADRALEALTRRSAEAAGLRDTGVIRPGARADLVLWTGHPVSPGSRATRAWVDGREVMRAD